MGDQRGLADLALVLGTGSDLRRGVSRGVGVRAGVALGPAEGQGGLALLAKTRKTRAGGAWLNGGQGVRANTHNQFQLVYALITTS